MRSIADPARAGSPAPTRVVLLSPAFSEPADFVRAGFVSAVRARYLPVDLVFAEVPLQHVTDRSALGEVQRELIAPARALGCAVWLGGISLGGFIALCCAEREPEALAGLCLFAPYLGSHIVTSEVAGMQEWLPGELADDDDERRIWQFIKARNAARPPIHLGLGREDRFGARHRLLAAALDPEDVDTVPGGHDWPTWHRLWENFLDARIAARD